MQYLFKNNSDVARLDCSAAFKSRMVTLLPNMTKCLALKKNSQPVVCLRGGERGTCLGPPLFGGHPLRYYAHKFSLFLVKDELFTHVMCYKANHEQVFCFQRAPLQKL